MVYKTWIPAFAGMTGLLEVPDAASQHRGQPAGALEEMVPTRARADGETQGLARGLGRFCRESAAGSGISSGHAVENGV